MQIMKDRHVHQIRLAGPWEVSMDDGDTWEACRLPLAATSAPRRLRRRFHRPTGLTKSSRVELQFQPADLALSLQVNDQIASVEVNAAGSSEETDCYCAADVTVLLDEFNTLICDLATDESLQAAFLGIVEGAE